MSANSASPPPSPRTSSSRLSLYNISSAFIRIRRVRQDREIVSTSGPEPITHPSLSNAVSTHKVSVRREDQFVCASGVDVPKLLRACRSTLLDQAGAIGANVLVDEQYVTAWRLSPILSYDHSSDGPPLSSPQRIAPMVLTKSRLVPGSIRDLSTCSANNPTRSSTLQTRLSRTDVTPGNPSL